MYSKLNLIERGTTSYRQIDNLEWWKVISNVQAGHIIYLEFDGKKISFSGFEYPELYKLERFLKAKYYKKMRA